MIQKEIFETLNSRTTLGKFYAKYILQLKLKKCLKSKVFDYWTKELNNFLVKKKFWNLFLRLEVFLFTKAKKN